MERSSNNSSSSGDSVDLDLSDSSSTCEEIDTNIQLGTQPYLFEPEADIDEEATTGHSPSDDKIRHSDNSFFSSKRRAWSPSDVTSVQTPKRGISKNRSGVKLCFP